jgi:hypothetical protein
MKAPRTPVASTAQSALEQRPLRKGETTDQRAVELASMEKQRERAAEERPGAANAGAAAA